MLRFTIFGIPVVVEPWFWLTAFLLGGGGRLAAGGSKSELMWVLVWIVVAFFSILIHELGHAMTARKLSGGYNHIRLWALGGLAYHEGSRQNRNERLWTIFMGPGAGFLLFLLTCVIILALYGPSNGMGVIKALIIHETHLETNVYNVVTSPAGRLFEILIWINFWWSIINLLPIYPLDGGQFFAEWTRKQQLAHQVGAFTGIAMAIVGYLFLGSLYIAILFGFLAFQNIQSLQSHRDN